MTVDFQSDDQTAAYGRFAGEPTQAELERFFLLDEADRELIGKRRGDHAPNAMDNLADGHPPYR